MSSQGDFPLELPLTAAVIRNDLDAVRDLIDAGADVFEISIKSRPLTEAANNGNVAIIELLLDSGADVNYRDGHGTTALGCAIQGDHYEAVRCLVSRGADLHIECVEGWPVLRAAVHHGNADIVKLLLQCGADRCAVGTDGLQPLHQAANQGQLAALRALVEFPGPLGLNALSDEGNTALMYSLLRKRPQAAAYLIEVGADPSAGNKKGVMALHAAAVSGVASLINPIVERLSRDQVLSRTQSGTSALDYAILGEKGGNYETFMALLKHWAGDDLGGPGSQALTDLLSQAVVCNQTLIAMALLDRGADASIPDSQGRRLLHRAASLGYEDVVELLTTQKGVDINATQGQLQLTALHYASMNGHGSVVSTLIRRGANISAKDKDGSTALPYAVGNFNMTCADVLLQHGANVNEIREVNGLTLLHTAVVEPHEQMVSLLLSHGADVNAHSSHGARFTPGIMATTQGNLAMMKLLAGQPGFDVDRQDAEGRAMLWHAASLANTNGIDLLLSRKPPANVNLKDRYGATPIMIAARNGFKEAVKALLFLAPDTISVPDHDHFGLDASGWAAKIGHSEIGERLSEHVAKQGSCRSPGSTTTQQDLSAIHVTHMPFDPDLQSCNVCERRIPEGLASFMCTSCAFTRFFICPDCKAAGATCRDASHAWKPWQG